MAGKGSVVLSLFERQEIERMCKEGRTNGNMSFHLGRSASCIKQEILRNGRKRSSYDAASAHAAYESRRKARVDKVSKHLTEEQIQLLTVIAEQGASFSEMSSQMGVSIPTLKRLLDVHDIKIRPIHFKHMEKRISSIEEQLKIAFDLIRGLMK